MQISELQDKKIAILGFGLEGQSTLKFLLKNGVSKENITLLDQKDIADNQGVEAVTWEEYLSGLSRFDKIFKTPGISPYHPKIARNKEKLTSQVEVFFANYEWKVIGVTATKGKSTTVTLIHEALKGAWVDSKLVGNIGQPVLDEIDLSKPHDYVVYELSSFMLEWIKPKMEIGLLGNVFRCHLDWHNDDFEVYKMAKHNVLEGAKYRISNIKLIPELKVPHVRYFGADGDYMYKGGSFMIHGQEVFNDQDVLLKWEHNRINIISVVGVMDIISQTGWPDRQLLLDSLKKVVASFTGLPHRLQEVGTFKGVTFVDDSISTTPESTIEAIKTYDASIGTLLLGWHDYGFEFESFAKFLADKKIKNIVFFPDTWAAIKKALDKLGHTYNSISVDSMEKAIKFAYENTKAWQVVLLSCASPSFSMYDNYKERWDDFKNIAKKLG